MRVTRSSDGYVLIDTEDGQEPLRISGGHWQHLYLGVRAGEFELLPMLSDADDMPGDSGGK